MTRFTIFATFFAIVLTACGVGSSKEVCTQKVTHDGNTTTTTKDCHEVSEGGSVN